MLNNYLINTYIDKFSVKEKITLGCHICFSKHYIKLEKSAIVIYMFIIQQDMKSQ
jgi:hypothetical protein